MHTRPRGLPRPSSHLLIAMTIFLVSLVATACVAREVFEGIPHTEDEVAFLFQAKTLASGRLYVPTPPNLEFYNLPFLIDRNGMWFGKYPPGYPMVLALGVIWGHPWLINPIMGSLALVIIYLTGRRLYGTAVGAVAASLGIVSPFFLMQSGSLLSHATTLFFTSLFIYSFLRVSENSSRRFAIIAGVCLGMAFLSRQLTAVGIAVPFVMYGLYRVLREPRPALSAYSWTLVSFIPFLTALLLCNAFFTGNPLVSTYELYWPFDKIGFGPGIGTGGQHTLSVGILDTRINMDSLSTHLFGWPWRLDLVFIAVASLALALRLVRYIAEKLWENLPRSSDQDRRQSLWDLLLLLMFVSLVAAYMLYWTTGYMYGPRYYFEAMPALLLLSARGIFSVATIGRFIWTGDEKSRIGNSTPASDTTRVVERIGIGRWTRLLSTTGTAVGVAFLVITSLTTSLPAQCDACRGFYGITGEAPKLVDRMSLKRALVFVPPGKNWTEYASLLALNTPTLDSDIVFALDLGAAHNQVAIEAHPGREVLYWTDLALNATP